MPNLFSVSGYAVFFWSGDSLEPIHVHVCKKRPMKNATKIWLTSKGGCVVAHNKSEIPSSVLNELMDFISAQFFYICGKWKDYFKLDKINFYC